MRAWLASTGLEEPFTRLLQSLALYLPRVLAAIAVLLVGWLLAGAMRALTQRLVTRWEKLAVVAPLQRELQGTGLLAALPKVVGAVVFWGLILTALAVVGELLGLRIVSAGFAHLAGYLPNILVAAIIVSGGFVVASLGRNAVTRAASAAGVRRAELLGKSARIALLFAAFVLALGQMGIDSTLLVSGISILLGAVVGSLALAFALGARETVAHIIALHYIDQSYRVGDDVRMGDVEGRIVELRTTSIVLDTKEGRTSIPAARFAEVPTTLRQDVR